MTTIAMYDHHGTNPQACIAGHVGNWVQQALLLNIVKAEISADAAKRQGKGPEQGAEGDDHEDCELRR